MEITSIVPVQCILVQCRKLVALEANVSSLWLGPLLPLNSGFTETMPHSAAFGGNFQSKGIKTSVVSLLCFPSDIKRRAE